MVPAPAGQAPLALTYRPSWSTPGAYNTYLDTLDQDSTLHTAPGYDDVTGLGGVTAAFVSSFAKR
ncbi:hypothetical protein P3T35_006360 [Kitasatospora sp. GP30]|uniref:hypothetical protein n=1 Tax=Kitasatospora sp. GP30 TaxID=3035084 RepID=UPI00117C13E7|nr:hypothetical protein [Kitasatospora sp. GP30]MDH6144318.1 hypothetical protein [Kitasatospora sp. GP30]